MKPRLLIPIAIAAFILIETALVCYGDLPLSLCIRGLETSHPGLIEFFRRITDAGKSAWYLWPLGIGSIGCMLVLRMRKVTPDACKRLAMAGRQMAFAFLCIAASGLLTDALKPLIGRGRPVEYQRENLYGFHPLTFHAAWNGMPSGHATTAFTLFALLSLFWPRWRLLWLALALPLAASRVMVNAHYLADIIAGAAVGLLTVGYIRRRFATRGMDKCMQCLFPIDKTHSPS